MPPPPVHRRRHNALLANSLRLTYHCLALLKRGVMRWGDLVEDGAIPLVLLELLAPTWQPVYLRRVGEILGSSDQYQGPDLGRWGQLWTSRKMLLFMLHTRRHAPRQPPPVWQAFGRLHLPRWDRDFIQRCPWKKLLVGTRMERLGGKLCPLDCRVEDHEHVFRNCFFSNFMFDTVRRAFGVVQGPSGVAEPSRLLRDHPLLSLTTTQGLLLWAGLKVKWSLRCRAQYQKHMPVLDEFIAGWAGVLRRWRAEVNMSCSRLDLYTFVEILDGWFSDPAMPGIFKGPAHKPTTARPPRASDTLALKEAKWVKYKNGKVQQLAALEQRGWTVAYTDGSAKTVRGWAQAGFGVWFHRGSPRNHSAHVLISEQQSVSRGELRGVLHAVLARRPGERLAVVMDSEYVFKGIMEWSPKRRRHGWRTSSGEVGHRDLWETILWERERAGDELQIHWIPSHLGVQGNEEADALAEAGRMSHPNDERPVAKRPQIEPMWEDLGLEELSSEVSSSQRSEFSSTTVSEAEDMESASTSSEGSEGGGSSSGFSTDVSTNPKRRRG